MLLILIDAAALIILLKVINKEDVSIGTAILISLVAAIGTYALAYGLALAMGIFGVLVAVVIAAVLLGVAVSAIFGVEIKRSFLIGGLFIVVHMAASFTLQAMFA